MSTLGASGFDGMGLDISAFMGGTGTTPTSPLAVTRVTPGSGVVGARDLKEITITFDRPIDPFSIGFDDFRLVREGDQVGFARPMVEALDASDPTNHRIVLTVGETLPAGRYQLSLSAWSFLTGIDGASLAWGGDRALGSFEVVESGPDRSGAIDLGVPASAPTVRPGFLDVAANPDASDTYKITLPAGRLYRLSLDVLAQADGGTLDAALSLHDAKGDSVASADRGGLGAPLDPRLVVGVPGGTYFIRVSGSPTGGRTDGPYRLRLAASPIDEGLSVTSLVLDRANALAKTPTGLTVRFSAPIDLDALRRDGSQEGDDAHALVLIDAGGRTWPLIATGVSPDQTAVSFAFRSELPAGTYRVRIGNAAILVDSAGQSPSARGQAPGVLGTIEIEARAATAPSDLGTLWPSAGSTIDASLALAPGEARRLTFTLIDRGFPSVTIADDAGMVRYSIIDSNGDTVVEAMGPESPAYLSGSWSRTFTLPAGTYSLILTNTDDDAVTFSLSLRSETSSSAALLDTGTGQSSKTPQVIAPIVPAGDPAKLESKVSVDIHPTTPSGPYTTPDVAEAVAPLAAGQAYSRAAGVPGSPTGSVILVEGTLAGLPSASSETIGVVGPTSGAGTFALTSSQPGLPSGLFVVNQSRPVGPKRAAKILRVGSKATTGPRGAEEKSLETDKAPISPDDLDDQVIVDAGWLDRAIAWVADRFRGGEATSPESEAGAVPSDEVPTPAGPEQESHVEVASLASPATIIASIMVAYRWRAERKRRARRPGGIASGVRSEEADSGLRHRLDPKFGSGVRP